MEKAAAALPDSRFFLLVDGNRLGDFPFPAKAVVHGDATSPSIAAASVIAKVTRDRMCADWDRQYPGFGIAGHKGYPTKAHRELVRELLQKGAELPPIYRRSFLGFAWRNR